MKPMIALVFVLVLLAIAALIIAASWNEYQFSSRCGQYIHRAAHCASVEDAVASLDTALKYCEQNRLTEGTTNVFLNNPDNDIGFWHQNLVAARDEMRTLGPATSELTKTNAMMRIREALSKQPPDGISNWPFNGAFLILAIILIPLAVIVLIVGAIVFAE